MFKIISFSLSKFCPPEIKKISNFTLNNLHAGTGYINKNKQ